MGFIASGSGAVRLPALSNLAGIVPGERHGASDALLLSGLVCWSEESFTETLDTPDAVSLGRLPS